MRGLLLTCSLALIGSLSVSAGRGRPSKAKASKPPTKSEIAACGEAAMRGESTWAEPDWNASPYAELDMLQRVAEAHWPEGSKDRNGRIDPIFGSAKHNPVAVREYMRLASDPAIGTICEVGYNWGATSLMWLEANQRARVFTFDLAERLYTNATLGYLNAKYDNRLTLVRGDSNQTIPAFTADRRGRAFSCDLVFVDGDHSIEGEFLNLKNFRELTPCAGSVYIMDDCDCARNMLPTTVAFVRGVDLGFIEPQTGHKTNAILRRSQKFLEKNVHHTFCTGHLHASDDVQHACAAKNAIN